MVLLLCCNISLHLLCVLFFISQNLSWPGLTKYFLSDEASLMFFASGKVSWCVHTTTDTIGDHRRRLGQLWAGQSLDGVRCRSYAVLWAQHTIHHNFGDWSSYHIEGTSTNITFLWPPFAVAQTRAVMIWNVLRKTKLPNYILYLWKFEYNASLDI